MSGPTPRRGAERPLRRFGQNFLVDAGIARRLVDAFDPRPGQTVVEIGPGRGVLTRRLAERCGRFVALELDERWIAGLREMVADLPHAEIRHADALKTDWDALAAELGGGALRVIGNLPYNVGTAIVRRLLASDAIRDMQVMLQAEVAGRLLAPAGRKAFGPLTVIAALRAERTRVMTVGPGAFRPRPRVRSTAIALVRRPDAPLPAAEIERIEHWLFRGFARRRKMLAGNLAPHSELVRAVLAELGLPEDARAEAVPPRAWLSLARRLDAAAASAANL